MNKQDLINILLNPVDISAADLKNLEALSEMFPYCQAAHILLAKGNADFGNMLAEQKIKKAAVYTVDRKNLKKIISLRKDLLPVAKKKTTDKSSLSPQPASETISQEEKENKNSEPANKTPLIEEPKIQEIGPSSQKTEEQVKRQDDLVNSFLKNFSPDNKEEESPPQINDKDAFSDKNTNNQQDEIVENTNKLTTSNNSFTRSEAEKEVEISETELLLNYLDFLKSESSAIKRDPEKINSIIEKFIKEDPAISPLKFKSGDEEEKDFVSPVLSKRKTPVSETFANMLVKQGKILKAIEIYQELLLKNPEKKAYFASRIEELKKQL